MTRPVTLFTGQWTDLSFQEIAKLANEMGYDGLEIACWGDHLNIDLAYSSEEYIKTRLQILETHNLKCWALGTHIIGQCVGDLYDKRNDFFAPSELARKPEYIKKWAIETMIKVPKVAKEMGCTVVTGFMGSPIWKFWYSFPPTPEEMVERGFQDIFDIWTPILDEFDKYNIKFALEVHPTEIAFDYYTTERLLKKFEYRETLGINFDPSHLIWQGIDPKVFLRDFGDRIYHVHMKDAAVILDGKSSLLGSHFQFGDLRRGWNFRSLGHGHVNFEEIIRELNSIKYFGPLSVEWEDNGMERIHGAKESVDFVKKIDFSPSTKRFDEDMKS
ncbi:MAG: sugar phosphate isomerase/epimerase [Candidatus Caldatribacteriota bacterium]|jgi:sugar phosphate isomerase/epimerase